MHRPIKITAHLATMLAGDAPRIDSLLESVLAKFHPKAVDGSKLDRAFPAPPPGKIGIPVRREWLGDSYVARASVPILAEPKAEGVEHFVKKIGVEHAEMLRPDARVVVATTNSWTKSYRLPLRVRRVDRVVWFAVGHHKETLGVLRRVPAIGKKTSYGYGRVYGWDVEVIDEDWSWFAESPAGPVLMATLPIGEWLPAGLIGARRDFGAASSPYWHPERYREIVTPC